MLAVGGMVAFGAYSHQAHYDTLGYMMMIGGVLIMIGGAIAMYGACFEKAWAAKVALIFIGISMVLMIAVAGYSASYESSIKTHAKEAFMSFTPQEKKEFEVKNKCCGFDVITEGQPNCVDKVACGKAFVKMIEKYPRIAMTISVVGAAVLVNHYC